METETYIQTPASALINNIAVFVLSFIFSPLTILKRTGKLVFFPTSDLFVINYINSVFFISCALMIYSGAMAYRAFLKIKKQKDFNIRYHNALNFFKIEKEMNK